MYFFVRRVIFPVLAQEKGGDFGDLEKNVIFLLTYPKKILQNLQMWDFFCNFVVFYGMQEGMRVCTVTKRKQ